MKLLLGGAALAVSMAACSFASLGYLQNGANDDADGGGQPPETLASGQTAPSLIAQDDTMLYWASANGVMSVSKSPGGTPKMISTATTVNSLAVDKGTTGNVYLAFGPTVTSVPKAGSTPTTIFTENDGGASPYDIAVDDTSVYLLQYDDTLAIPGRVVRFGKDGSALQEFMLEPTFDPATMNIDDTNVTWSSAGSNESAFFQTAKNAGPSASPTKLALGKNDELPTTSAEVVVTSDKIFWTDETNVYSRTHDAVATTVTIYTQPSDIVESFIQLAFDGTYVYALDSDAGDVRRISPDGSGTTIVASGLTLPSSLVVDAEYLYLSVQNAGSQGTIVRVPKK